jgi:uncharacterized protein YcfJ
MRKRFAASALALGVLLASAAAQATVYTDSRGHRMECHRVRVAVRSNYGTGAVAGTLIGGAAGGLLGNQFGKGSGNAAMTGVGAVGGAVAGHEVGKNADTHYVYRRRCHRLD